MSPELKQILDTLQQFADKFEAKAWYDKNRDEIIPLLTDLYEIDKNQYDIIIEEMIVFMPHGMKKLKDEIKARVNREYTLRMEAKLQDHWRDGVEPPNLTRDKNGNIDPTPLLLVDILKKSKYLRIVQDEHTEKTNFESYGEYKLPWATSDKNSLVIDYQIEHKEKGVNRISYHPANVKFQRSALRYYLANFFDKEVYWTALQDAINIVANDNRINIAQDYYNNGIVEWDGKDHMDILHRFAGVKNRDWSIVIMHSITLGIMARVFSPGYNFRGTPVLVGDEKLGKSWFAEALAFNQRFYATLTFDKNTTEAEIGRLMEGRIVMELADTGGIGSRNDNFIKAFLVKTIDNFRRMREDDVENIARTCIFIVTSNKMEYYLGTTGTTRFLPCEVTYFDMESILAELPQVFAQAKYLWDMGISPRLTDAESKLQQEMVAQQEIKPNFYYLLLKQLKVEDYYKYFETNHAGFQHGIKIDDILQWFRQELWYSSDKENKYRGEIIDVLKRYFHIEAKVARVPDDRKIEFKNKDVDKSYRYLGNVDWVTFVNSLDD
jgi:predicted P-loop ATPase